MSNSVLAKLIEKNEWIDIPSKIITREGHIVDASSNQWHLPYSMRAHSTLDFNNIINHSLRWITKRYIQEKIQRTSTHAGYSNFQDIKREFIRFQHDYGLIEKISGTEIENKLISVVENRISQAREKHRLWVLYRPIQWYIWCAENYPELGFCPAYAMELDSMVLPGNPKGEAVRMEDPDRGPLHRSLELPLVIKALREDKSSVLEHIQQKVAVALSIALGRNPANLTYLRETDFINLTPGSGEPCYILKMPRIKKRQLNPRDDFMEEYLDTEFATYIQELITANQTIKTIVTTKKGDIEVDRPLFINTDQNKAALSAGILNESFNMPSAEISELVKKFAKRHHITSPLTGEILYLSTRRLRYTLATSLASEGISRRELARLLDHTDTQHVQVYFDVAGSIVEHLDKASAKGFAKYLDYFKGRIVDNASDAINGERNDKHLSFINENNPIDQTEIGVCGENNICHLDPPFSCYLCPKFQPYRHANHEHVLECLLKSRTERMEKYENARLGIQLDDVIFAVAQVTEQCKGEGL
jgi:hypothetical protein